MKMHSIECCAFSVAELVRSLGSISTSDPYQPFMKGPLMAESGSQNFVFPAILMSALRPIAAAGMVEF